MRSTSHYKCSGCHANASAGPCVWRSEPARQALVEGSLSYAVLLPMQSCIPGCSLASPPPRPLRLPQKNFGRPVEYALVKDHAWWVPRDRGMGRGRLLRVGSHAGRESAATGIPLQQSRRTCRGNSNPPHTCPCRFAGPPRSCASWTIPWMWRASPGPWTLPATPLSSRAGGAGWLPLLMLLAARVASSGQLLLAMLACPQAPHHPHQLRLYPRRINSHHPHRRTPHQLCSAACTAVVLSSLKAR